MIAGVGERPFALPRLRVDLPLTEIERSLLDVVLELELTQALAGCVVVMMLIPLIVNGDSTSS